jgi:hypothetical protein
MRRDDRTHRQRSTGATPRPIAVTVEDYLAELSEEQRENVGALCGLIREHPPAGYREAMNRG